MLQRWKTCPNFYLSPPSFQHKFCNSGKLAHVILENYSLDSLMFVFAQSTNSTKGTHGTFRGILFINIKILLCLKLFRFGTLVSTMSGNAHLKKKRNIPFIYCCLARRPEHKYSTNQIKFTRNIDICIHSCNWTV